MNQNSDKLRTETEERLANLAVRVIRALETVNAVGPNAYVVEQVLRASVSAFVVNGDRGGNPSFLDHLRACLQDLVVTRRGLILIRRLEWAGPGANLDELIDEADILVRIFFSSVRTVESKQNGGGFHNGGAASRPAPADDMEPNWPEDPKPVPALGNGGAAATASRARRVGR